MDFVGPLPEDDGFNCILTITDRLGSDMRIIPCRTNISAKELATLFFREWYCENGLPLETISNRDKLFVSQFWKYLHRLTGVKLRLSTAFHPRQTALVNVLIAPLYRPSGIMSSKIRRGGLELYPLSVSIT